MTSELTSETPRAESTPPTPGGSGRAGAVVRLHLRVALAFLVLGALLMALTAARVVFPSTLTGVSVLSYGRVLPVAVGLFVYGWLTIGLVGAGYFILPRVSGKELRYPGLATGGLVLLSTGIVAGTLGVLLGLSEGRQYLEFPLWADALIVLGLLAVVRVFTATIATPSEEALAPAEWFFGSAPVWLLLSFVVGNYPGLNGVNSVLQTAFFRGALFGLWLAAAGIGVVYYLVSALTGRDPRKITQLTVAGFWSLAFVFSLAAGSRLTYTTAPDWLETVAGLFSIALFLPVAVILVDVATALREEGVRRGGAFRYLVAGAVAFAIIPVVNLALSLRSSNAIIGLTDWSAALDTLIVFGVGSFWLFAFIGHTSLRAGTGTGHLVASLAGVAAATGTMLVSGVQAGLTWVAAANSGEVSVGEGFETVAGGMEGHQWVRFAGFGLFALAQLWLLFAAWSEADAPASDDLVPEPEGGEAEGGETGESEGSAAEEASADPAGSEEPEAAESGDDDSEGDDTDDDSGGLPEGIPITLGKVRVGTLGIFVVVALFAFGFPLFETEHTDATILADAVRNYETDDAVAAGREVYLAEGCWYCHTQEVRGIVTDVGLGPVAEPGDYAHETPSSAGVIRVGPDLMFAGSREPTSDPAWVEEFLRDPRAIRTWSTMPAHDFLGDDDLRNVAAYIASLRQFEFE